MSFEKELNAFLNFENMMFTTSTKEKKQRKFRTKKIGLDVDVEQQTTPESTGQQNKTESEIASKISNDNTANQSQELPETRKEQTKSPPQKKKPSLNLLSFNEVLKKNSILN
jgi:hypothetical protein